MRNGPTIVLLESDTDYYTAKYGAADGALFWNIRYHGPGNYADEAKAVAVDASENHPKLYARGNGLRSSPVSPPVLGDGASPRLESHSGRAVPTPTHGLNYSFTQD